MGQEMQTYGMNYCYDQNVAVNLSGFRQVSLHFSPLKVVLFILFSFPRTSVANNKNLKQSYKHLFKLWKGK